MEPVIALIFTEQVVRVTEDPDLTCLIRIDCEKQTIVGNVLLSRRKLIHVNNPEKGWTAINTQPPIVLQVVRRE